MIWEHANPRECWDTWTTRPHAMVPNTHQHPPISPVVKAWAQHLDRLVLIHQLADVDTDLDRTADADDRGRLLARRFIIAGLLRAVYVEDRHGWAEHGDIRTATLARVRQTMDLEEASLALVRVAA